VRTALWNRIRDIARQYRRTGPSDPLDPEIDGKEDSPLDLAIGHETLERYEAALDRLRPEEKELIIGRIEMGLPHAEIAAMFDKPSVAAVHMAVSRALVRLAEEMAHERRS
jgi:RNA polymerase sigma factor (sigma-70 family)